MVASTASIRPALPASPCTSADQERAAPPTRRCWWRLRAPGACTCGWTCVWPPWVVHVQVERGRRAGACAAGSRRGPTASPRRRARAPARARGGISACSAITATATTRSARGVTEPPDGADQRRAPAGPAAGSRGWRPRPGDRRRARGAARARSRPEDRQRAGSTAASTRPICPGPRPRSRDPRAR